MTTTDKESLVRPKTSDRVHDDDIFDTFESIHPKDVYSNLTIKDNDRKRTIVDSWHDGRDADLTAQTLNQEDLDGKIAELKQFKKELLARDDLDPTAKQLYRWKVNEDIANIYMLQASAQGDMRNFRRWNEFIYGKPDELIYRAALDFVAHDAESMLQQDGSDEAKASAREVLASLEGKRGSREMLYPESQIFDKLRKDHWRAGGYYALLMLGTKVPESSKVTPDIGVPILDKVVHDNLQSDYTLEPSSSTTWEVSHKSGAVKYPGNFNMAPERFIGLGLGHEIGTHLLERVNGLRSALKLAGVGLDRQETGSEGRGVVREELAYENHGDFQQTPRWQELLRRHIAISYASGLDGGEKTSSEVFSFVSAIDKMYALRDEKDASSDETVKAANAKTDALLLRVLKGTDGKGGAYLKDKIYLEGYVATWLTAAVRGVRSVSDGDVAKFDINNGRHIEALQKLGILPSSDSIDRIVA
jgi:hypothetical protein